MRERSRIFLPMNRLPRTTRAAIIRALVDGASLRAAARIAGVNKDTVAKLLVDVGEFCEFYQHHALTKLNTRTVELDEIWSFVGAREGNKKQKGHGDLWTYTAIDADSKLVFSWIVTPRTDEVTRSFCLDVARRLTNRVQITTDANWSYRAAIDEAFGQDNVDYGQVVKRYALKNKAERAGRYSPSMVCTKIVKTPIYGNPDMTRISTSYVERQNLQMRMNMRRFTRLTNAFSKKASRHALAVALHYMIYNYVRPHGTLTKNADGVKTTPAMAAGVAKTPWTVEHILAMIDGDVLLGVAA
jgi:IS1 family transposase